MKRAERHHLKQDEFVHWIDQVIIWVTSNQRQIVNAALVVVGAGLLLSGLYVYRGRQAETARALLREALRQYHGVVRAGTGAPPTGNVATFESEEEKYRTASASFETLATEYKSYDEGRQALYYLGLCQASLSEPEAAMESLRSVRGGKRDLVYYLASQALAALLAEQGDEPGAVEIYQSLVEDGDNPLPKDHLLFEVAKIEERAGNTVEARQYYERMLAEHPDSQLRIDAMTRSERLALAASGGTNASD